MRQLFALLSTVAILLSSPVATVAQEQRATLLVAVVDDGTGTALERARVRLEARPGAWFTDRTGRAELKNVASGPQTVEVSVSGYAMRRFPLRLAGGANEPVQVTHAAGRGRCWTSSSGCRGGGSCRRGAGWGGVS